ncbi:NAD(P)H-binding protein [Rarobacter incanus]|nr:NAD(P)H-binding protein [Rarobacter incanus]
MKVVIIGGHGKVALLLARALADRGQRVVSAVRNPLHVADVERVGATGVLLDIENASLGEVTETVRGADVVVFAAGAGAGSGAERKWSVDRDGAMLAADASEIAGVARLIVVSAMGADLADPGSTDVFQIYLRAKAEADASVRARDLAWTIVRPGRLTDGAATGRITLGQDLARGEITRADVADLLCELAVTGHGERRQFDVVSGETPIAQAAAAV